MNIKTLPLNEIIIPDEYKERVPSPHKIFNAYIGFIKENKPRRRIAVNEDGILIHGYARYLVCKMFDYNTVEVEVQETNIEEVSHI